jgi:hypothetical protein
LKRRYFLREADLEPRVFYRLTDNWVEMSLRFIAHDSGTRGLKDQMSREILEGFERSGIASGTYEVVGMPKLQVEVTEAGPGSAQ